MWKRDTRSRLEHEPPIRSAYGRLARVWRPSISSRGVRHIGRRNASRDGRARPRRHTHGLRGAASLGEPALGLDHRDLQPAVAAEDLDVDAVMLLICKRIQKLTHAESATILILDGDDFVMRVATGFLEDRVGTRVPIEGSLPGWMHLHDESGILADAKTDPRAGRIAHETGMRSGVAVQLCHRDEKIGQLIVASRQPNAFAQQDVDALNRLSDILSLRTCPRVRVRDEGPAGRGSCPIRDDLSECGRRHRVGGSRWHVHRREPRVRTHVRVYRGRARRDVAVRPHPSRRRGEDAGVARGV